MSSLLLRPFMEVWMRAGAASRAPRYLTVVVVWMRVGAAPRAPRCWMLELAACEAALPLALPAGTVGLPECMRVGAAPRAPRPPAREDCDRIEASPHAYGMPGADADLIIGYSMDRALPADRCP